MSAVQYVFIDGTVGYLPWSSSFYPVLLTIKNCIKNNINIHCNGLAHFSAYYYLSTGFDKPYKIISSSKCALLPAEEIRKVEFQYQQETGDLKSQGQIICNAGVRLAQHTCRPFSLKSTQALKNGLQLHTPFHLVAFNSKNGQKILKNIDFPFKFYCNKRMFCTKKAISRTKANLMVETQNKEPLAFNYKDNLLSTYGMCPQFIKIIQNWLLCLNGRAGEQSNTNYCDFIDTAVQNKLNTHFKRSNTAKTSILLNKMKTVSSRPTSSKFSVALFDKPSVRCSGTYKTEDGRYLQNSRINKTKNLGKNRMNFAGKLQSLQMQNYVSMTPSRPASSHKYRQIDKNKWIGGYTFIV